MAELTVGFDLDMTLIDSRPGIAAVYDALVAETGAPIDVAVAVGRLGPPLEDELSRWVPAADVGPLADRFRELYPSRAIESSVLMPGARESIQAVRRHGGRVVVVTGKYGPNAQLHLDHLDLDVDDLIGWVWGPDKGVVLREHRAGIYVGDHLGDVAGAKAAGALSVAVTTGPIAAAPLRQAGADVVLKDLTEFPRWLDGHILDTRLQNLAKQLRDLRSVAVAFSGGADSAFLLAAAVRVLGSENVIAITAVSPSLPAAELEMAREFTGAQGVRHETPATMEMTREGYRANAGDRCYFCKAELLEVLTPLAVQLGIEHVVTGTNADDARAGFRPGIRAAAERQALTPLLDAGLTKSQIRAASRDWGLRTWDKPASACLSSRVAYGVRISPARLARVEQAEHNARAALESAGIVVSNLRVRDLGDRARIEVDADRVGEIAAGQSLAIVLAAVRSAGFDEVEIDPKGFRSGAMNELLTDPDRYR